MSEPSTFPFFDDYSPPPPPFDFCDLGLCFPPPPPPPRPPPPPPPPAKTSSSSTGFKFSTGVVVGLAAGGAVVVLMVVVFLVLCLVCCKKKKDRLTNGEAEIYQSAQPVMKPAPSLFARPAGGVYDGANQHWQQSYPPPPPKDQLPPRPLVPPSPLAPSSLSEQYTTTQSGPNTSSSASDSYGSGPTSIGSQSQASLYGNKKRLGFSMNVFSYEDLLRATDGFSDNNFLGQGGFGPVYKGILSNGKEVAVKSLRAGSSQGDREFEAEVETVSRVHHRHLVSLVGYCATDSTKLLVYEFVPNGTLQFHLHGKGIPVLNWEARMKIAIGSARGLAYLHYDCNPKIIHRDIKAANILLDSQFEAKVADFGLAKFTSDQDTHVSTRIMGTFGYLAPEYAASGKLTDKSDVFSFGVVLLELITGRNPSSQFNMEDSLVEWAKPLLQMATGSGNFDLLVDPRLENNYNRYEVDRMVACASASVRHSSRKRPSMSQVARALEGNMSLTELNQGLKPGHSTLNNSSYPGSDNDSGQYMEDLRRFRQVVGLRGQDSGGISTSSEYGGGNAMSQEMETGTSRTGSRDQF